MQKLYYLANPYNGTDHEKKERFEQCCQVTSRFIKNGVHLFSPVVHNHAMIETVKDWSVEQRQSLILPYDFSFLKRAAAMILLKLDGWEKSYGVEKELEFCCENKIQTFAYTYDQIFSDQGIIEKFK
jgi:hypothetical protein